MAVIVGVAVIVIAPGTVAALVNGNDTVGVIDAVNDPGMLHFQKLDVDPRSSEFLVLAHHVRGHLPEGHAELADRPRLGHGVRRPTELLEWIVAMLSKLIDP